MKTLFLSHCPHEAHINFAKSIDARIKIIPFNNLVKLEKKIKIIGKFYPLICIVYGFFISIKEDILLVDGGSSFWVAFSAKIRSPRLKIIYLDGDLFIINLGRNSTFIKKLESLALKKIDAVISVSHMNGTYAKKFINVPVEVCPPFPKNVKEIKTIERKNYGLFVGRLDPDKDIIRIIEFGIQCPYLEKIIVVGNGAFAKKIETMTKTNDKILFVGEKKDPSEYYSQCKFLLHFPDFEPHPCTTMEAAECGCFPIVSKNTGSNYLFDKIFIIDDPADFESINRRIKFILENEQTVKDLLKKSLPNIPSKEESANRFREKFNKLIKL